MAVRFTRIPGTGSRASRHAGNSAGARGTRHTASMKASFCAAETASISSGSNPGTNTPSHDAMMSSTAELPWCPLKSIRKFCCCWEGGRPASGGPAGWGRAAWSRAPTASRAPVAAAAVAAQRRARWARRFCSARTESGTRKSSSLGHGPNARSAQLPPLDRRRAWIGAPAPAASWLTSASGIAGWQWLGGGVGGGGCGGGCSGVRSSSGSAGSTAPGLARPPAAPPARGASGPGPGAVEAGGRGPAGAEAVARLGGPVAARSGSPGAPLPPPLRRAAPCRARVGFCRKPVVFL